MLRNLVFVFLILCVLSAFGSFPGRLPASDPDHPGKCWFAEKEMEMDVDDKITSTTMQCVQYTCIKYEGDFYFTRVGCSGFAPTCGYRIQDGDLSKPYPDCCPTTVRDTRFKCSPDD